MAIMTINAVAKAGSASWTGNYSLIWSGLTMLLDKASSYSNFYVITCVSSCK